MKKNKTLYEAPLAEAFSVTIEQNLLVGSPENTPTLSISDYEELDA